MLVKEWLVFLAIREGREKEEGNYKQRYKKRRSKRFSLIDGKNSRKRAK